MAKYTGADCRLCRREGTKLYLKGEKCTSEKCPFNKRPNPPGQHGAARKKATGYSIQLREKQKTKRIYGLCEKQFHGYFIMAEKMRGVTGENMLALLERRLDNVVYRIGLGSSRAMARQIVNHGLVTVNGKRVNIPSYLIKAGDVVAVKDNKQSKTMFDDIKANAPKGLPKWLTFDNEKLAATVVSLPERADIELNIEEHLIVELYSK
ncbi:MAG: 30S ribosomal protein S4 [Clostridia bacterium]|jgi:small subunit ribosomal protein S4|nr:30S ribosomal protein S4 [Clostridia bacterium]MCX4367420.1 30S ribosomal protein S4 [Clostridia bacterium]